MGGIAIERLGCPKTGINAMKMRIFEASKIKINLAKITHIVPVASFFPNTSRFYGGRPFFLLSTRLQEAMLNRLRWHLHQNLPGRCGAKILCFGQHQVLEW